MSHKHVSISQMSWKPFLFVNFIAWLLKHVSARVNILKYLLCQHWPIVSYSVTIATWCWLIYVSIFKKLLITKEYYFNLKQEPHQCEEQLNWGSHWDGDWREKTSLIRQEKALIYFFVWYWFQIVIFYIVYFPVILWLSGPNQWNCNVGWSTYMFPLSIMLYKMIH